MNFFLVSIIIVFLFGFVAGRFTFSTTPSLQSAQGDDVQPACNTPVKSKVAQPPPPSSPSNAPAKTEQELLDQMAQNAPCHPEVFDDPSAEEIIEDHEDRGEPLDSPYEEEGQQQ